MKPRLRLLACALIGAWPHVLIGLMATLLTAWVLPRMTVTGQSARTDRSTIVPFIDTSTLQAGGAPDPARAPSVRIQRYGLQDRFTASPSELGHGGRGTEAYSRRSGLRNPSSRDCSRCPRQWSRLRPVAKRHASFGSTPSLPVGAFRALAGEVWFPMTFCAFRYEVRNALTLGGSRGGDQRLLPLRPIPLGLLLDTLLWTCVSWVAALVAGALMRRRARSGRCTSCGHRLDANLDRSHMPRVRSRGAAPRRMTRPRLHGALTACSRGFVEP